MFIAAASGFVLLGIAFAEGLPSTGVRNTRGTSGWVLFAPIALLLAALVLGRRAVRAVAPWRVYLTSTSPEQRRADRALDLQASSSTALWIAGAASVAGLVLVVTVFAATSSGPMRSPAGIVVVLEASILLLMLAAGCLGLALRIVRSRRNLPPPR